MADDTARDRAIYQALKAVDEVAAALQKYADLGVKHFVLSDTPYLSEVSRIGEQVLPLLGNAVS